MRDREWAVEISLVLLSRPREVEPQRLALDRRGQLDLQVALAGLEHILGGHLAVGQFAEARAGAPLGVIQHRRERLLEQVRLDALVQLTQPPCTHASGGELRAQVGPALIGLAHLPGQLRDSVVVEDPRLDHHALVGQRAAVSGHRARSRAAHVGVVGPVGSECDQLAGDEHGRDHGDVGQVSAASIRVVEDPDAVRRLLLIQDRPHRRGHRPEVDRDVLRLHDHFTARLEQRRRGVAPLLDVGRVS